MEPHGQARGPQQTYPPAPRLRWVIRRLAKSAEAQRVYRCDGCCQSDAFLHGQGRACTPKCPPSPEGFVQAGVTARRRGLLRRRMTFVRLAIFILPMVLTQCTDGKRVSESNPKGDFKPMREKMVENQIKARGVKDPRVLNALLKVERHRFVPEKYLDSAYSDQPLPIGEGQTISQPYIVALMTELLELKGNEKVLEIGTGSGYQAAILSELAKEVYTIEIVEALASMAKKRLSELDYQNVKVKAGDGYLGWPEAAPFDAIIVTAAPDHIPKPLIEQLKEGGRMVVPVGSYAQELKKIVKRSGKMETTNIIPVVFVPMTGEGVKQKK
jgi:protein-L-isoaspartate(D-aspartate) O-methyltransferase